VKRSVDLNGRRLQEHPDKRADAGLHVKTPGGRASAHAADRCAMD
jgi:hypothetical protein